MSDGLGKQQDRTLVLECHQLSKRYGNGKTAVDVLSGLELQVEQGERLAIMGSSGSGKSTLLNILGGLDTPSSGEVSVSGKPLYAISEKVRAELRNQPDQADGGRCGLAVQEGPKPEREAL